jgi:sugar phosphate isomerase/epimerase
VPSIALQLFTVRDDLARDFEGTIARVGELGFAGVELFTLEGREAAAVRSALDAAGLAAAGWHAPLAAVEGDLAPVAADLRALGTDRLTLAWIEPPADAAAADALADRLAAVAERAAGEGLRFAFHNHAGELRPLEDGRSFLDRLLEREGIDLELDLGWVWDAGADPEEWLHRAAGRCPLVHVKDFSRRGERAFAPVGDGAVGYERVVPAAVAAGAEWLIAEQDETEGPALDAAARSLDAIRRFLEAVPA